MKQNLVIIVGTETIIGSQVLQSIAAEPINLAIVAVASGRELFPVLNQDGEDLGYSKHLTVQYDGDAQFVFSGGGALRFEDYEDARLLVIPPSLAQPVEGRISSIDCFLEQQEYLQGMARLVTGFAACCAQSGIRGRIVAVSSPSEQRGIRRIAASPSQAVLEGLVSSIIETHGGGNGVTAALLRTGIPESLLESELVSTHPGHTLPSVPRNDGWLPKISSKVAQYLVTGEHPYNSQVIDI